MESKHWTGDDDRDRSARLCDRCDDRDATKKWDYLYVCGECYTALDNYDGEPVEFEREMAKKYPETAA